MSHSVLVEEEIRSNIEVKLYKMHRRGEDQLRVENTHVKMCTSSFFKFVKYLDRKSFYIFKILKMNILMYGSINTPPMPRHSVQVQLWCSKYLRLLVSGKYRVTPDANIKGYKDQLIQKF